MSDQLRIPGYKAVRILQKKYDINWPQASFILVQRLKGYLLPEGERLGSPDAPFVSFYNDIDVYRYELCDTDIIVPYHALTYGAAALYTIWKNNQEIPDYPYKLDIYSSNDHYYHCFHLLSKEDTVNMDIWEIIDKYRIYECFFRKHQIDALIEVFGS